MTQYGSPKHVRMMVDERIPLDRELAMAEENWQCHGRGAWLSLEDPQLSPMHKSIIEQIATMRYGRRGGHGAR